MVVKVFSPPGKARSTDLIYENTNGLIINPGKFQNLKCRGILNV